MSNLNLLIESSRATFYFLLIAMNALSPTFDFLFVVNSILSVCIWMQKCVLLGPAICSLYIIIDFVTDERTDAQIYCLLGKLLNTFPLRLNGVKSLSYLSSSYQGNFWSRLMFAGWLCAGSTCSTGRELFQSRRICVEQAAPVLYQFTWLPSCPAVLVQLEEPVQICSRNFYF